MVYFDCTDWSEDGYSEATVITRLNNMGDQYSEFEIVFATHDHDEDYYLKADSDAKFWNFVDKAGDYDTLDGYHGQDIKNMAIVLNGIYIWGGEFENIPEQFKLCNGLNTTPNLVGSQIVGAGNAYSPGSTGGVETITPAGTVIIGTHALTINEIPAHTHSYIDTYNVVNGNYNGIGSHRFQNPNTPMEYSGSGQAHGHSGSTLTGTPYEKSGSYIKLPYIKKTI